MQVLVAPMEAVPSRLHNNEQQGDTYADEDGENGLAAAANATYDGQQQVQEQHDHQDEDLDVDEQDDEDQALRQRQQRLQKSMQQGQDISGSGIDVRLLASSDDHTQGMARGRSAAAAARKAHDIARGTRAASPMSAAAAAFEVGR
jgi:hypothetical protein